MTFELSSEAATAGFRLAAFDSVPSTSAEALAAAREGEGGPVWFVARHQTRGKGRRGNAWQTSPENLAASLLLTTDLPPATIAQLGFVAGVALVRALEACSRSDPRPVGGGGRREAPDGGGSRSSDGPAPHPARADARVGPPLQGRDRRPLFRLKWPNDVLLGDGKLAGILLQTEALPGGRFAVAVGIGVNVADAPAGLPYPAISLREAGLAVTAEQLFQALTAAWVGAAALWDGGRAFPDVRDAWLGSAAGIGTSISVRAGDALLAGVFETIDGAGQLVLRGADGRARTVSAGDVHFGEARTARPEAAE